MMAGFQSQSTTILAKICNFILIFKQKYFHNIKVVVIIVIDLSSSDDFSMKTHDETVGL